MNMFEVLERDHADVRDLFEEIQGLEEGSSERLALFARLKGTLEIHASQEERYFYPLLQDVEETRDLALQAMEEHAIVKTMLAELAMGDPDDDHWSALLEDLRATVDLHVEEEESQMFRRARKLISREQAEDLGTILEDEKQAAMRASDRVHVRADTRATRRPSSRRF